VDEEKQNTRTPVSRPVFAESFSCPPKILAT